MRKLDRRFAEVMIGLILLIAGLSALAENGVVTLVLVVMGLYLLARQFNWRFLASNERHASEADFSPLQSPLPPPVDQVYAHALDAVRSAGLDPAETHVLPTDIGVMAFSGDQEPVIYRTRPVLDDVDYVQPFVQLRLPTSAQGRIRFEILDSDGQAIFIHEADHQFERGRNLVTPAARLPVHDAQALHGSWHLRVSADGTRIADHQFGWLESTSRVIRRQIGEDGELSGEVRAMMAENRLQRMSLDELLEQQGDGDETPSRQQSRR